MGNLLLTAVAFFGLFVGFPVLLIILLRWGEWRRIPGEVLQYAQVAALYVLPAAVVAGLGWLVHISQ